MIVYIFDKTTREYVGSHECQLSETGHLKPRYSLGNTPKHGDNETSIESNGVWEIVPDFRGEKYYNLETGESKLFDIGEVPDLNWITKKRNTIDETWNPDSEEWEVLFSAKQNRKYTEIKKDFEDELSKGFQVSLGFRIDSKLSDLTLLSVAYSKGKLKNKTEIKISDFDNIINEIVLLDFETILSELGDFTDQSLEKKWTLRAQIFESVTEDELNFIGW